MSYLIDKKGFNYFNISLLNHRRIQAVLWNAHIIEERFNLL